MADAAATRTFVVWSTYAQGRARGVLEPPAEPVDPVLRTRGAELVGGIRVHNLEPEPLLFTRRRVDTVPCDPDAGTTEGPETAVAIEVPARGTIETPFTVATASIPPSVCSVVVHLWGSTASGKKAQSSVVFDREGRRGNGATVDEPTRLALQYVTEQGLTGSRVRVTEEELVRLCRERMLPSSIYGAPAARLSPRNLPGGPARQPCNPDAPADPEYPNDSPGFTCQPTGRWEGNGPGERPLDERVANAFKGDSILVRNCAGAVGPIVGALDPPQLYTHVGMMTKNNVEVSQSVGDDDYLQRFPNGVAGQPSNGFQEGPFRYNWPGKVTTSVREALVIGRPLLSPAGGRRFNVKGFTRTQQRCPGDAQVVYPRVLKPAPELDRLARGRLHAAADAAKALRAHYRFSDYSDGRVATDPNGPAPFESPAAVVDDRIVPATLTYGPTRSVCSSFIRLALQAGGFTELDRDKTFPRPSAVGPGVPDGLFFYDAAERRSSADVLYAFLHNKVDGELSNITAASDNFWSAGLGTIPLFGYGAVFVSGALARSGTLVSWATDAPDDVANQVVNCFASDFCAEDAKDSSRWEDPGTGVAVAPDDLLNHYDSPLTGGPYGYDERMVFRGKD